MTPMSHHKNPGQKWGYSVAHAGFVAVNIDLSWMARNIPDTQAWLGEQVLQSSRAFMPFVEGTLRQRSHTAEEGRKVIFPGPSSRFLYMGVAMVDSKTGRGPFRIEVSPGEFIFRFRKGATLRPTTRKLNYSSSEACDHWFEAAKARDKDAWVRGAKERLVKR